MGALDRKVSQDGDREKNWAAAAIGAVSGYEKKGWRGAVAGAVGGFFGRKLGEEAANRELSESSQWSVGQQVALETKLVNDVLEFAAKRISTGDRIRGAITGGAMGFYDFGMQGAVGGAIGGWFGRRKLSGSFGVNGGWSQGQGANVNAELKFNWKKGAVAEDKKWTSPKASVAILQVIPGAEVTHQPNLDEIHAQVQWIGAVERAAQAGSAIAAQALATDKQVGEQPREKGLGGAAAGAVEGYLKGGWKGAVVGALRGFGRKLSEQTAPSQERRNLRLNVGKMVGIETQLVKDVFRCIMPAINREEAQFAAKSISLGDRVRGAAYGGAMGYYDFGMQG